MPLAFLSHLELVPSQVGGAAFPFLWTSTLCLVGPGQGWWDKGLSCLLPSCTPLLLVGTKHKLMSHFAGMAPCGDVPMQFMKRSQSKKRTTRVVGMVAQCQWGVSVCRHAVACAPWARRTRCLHLGPVCLLGTLAPWPSLLHLGVAGTGPCSKHLHVGIAQGPPGNKFPERRLHCLAAHILMLHLPCGTLLPLTVCSVWCGFSYKVGAFGFGVVQRQMLPMGPHIWWRYSSEVWGGCSPADALKLSQGAKRLLKTRLSYEPPLDPICNPPALSTAIALFAHG